MGYSTDFEGRIEISPPLSTDQVKYINAFSSTRRMARHESMISTMSDPLRKAVGLPVGKQGEFYVGSTEDFGQAKNKSIIDFNTPPLTQPGLWCDWEVSDDGKYLQWNKSEKFYEYISWLKYMVNNFFNPWKVSLNGEISWAGEESDDIGVIVAKNSAIEVFEGLDFKKYMDVKNSKTSLQDELKINLDSNLLPLKKYKI